MLTQLNPTPKRQNKVAPNDTNVHQLQEVTSMALRDYFLHIRRDSQLMLKQLYTEYIISPAQPHTHVKWCSCVRNEDWPRGTSVAASDELAISTQNAVALTTEQLL